MTRAGAPQLVHASAVMLTDAEFGDWAVLLRGPSGAGKSDLALRVIDRGGVLISDDQTELQRRGSHLLAAPPAAIAGKLEVRGLGIVELPYRAGVPVALIVDLRPAEEIDRLPETTSEDLCGIAVRCIELDPAQPSAPQKLRLALRSVLPLIMPGDPTAEAEAGGDMSDSTALQERPGGTAAAGDGATRLVLVTGMSGAGRSTALHVLEDEGYESIDNLPLRLLNAVVNEVGLQRPIAVGVDIRTRDFAVDPVIEQLDRLADNPRFATTMLFVDCDDEVLVRRFTETRRRHPLAQGRPVADGVAMERRLVAPLRERADLVIDSSFLTPAELRRQLLGRFGLAQSAGMSIFVTSFSFRQGLPREADLVFDVRFLANPHYDPELRPLSGQDAPVGAYVEQDPGFAPFFGQLTAMLGGLLPRYEQEGKTYLTIAIGCTGGRHRSVFVAERLAAWLSAKDRQVHLAHRDIVHDAARSAIKP